MGNQSLHHRGRKRMRISRISAIHYAKLVFRSLLFICAALDYILVRFGGTNRELIYESIELLKYFIWIIFALEMTLRFFPSKLESMGCQKQFSRNYIPAGKVPEEAKKDRSRLWVAIAWIALNAAIGGLYFAGWIDEGILILVSLAYSVCDMICILFFCPFQVWFMKNKCCGSCRIYNWDYAMMFTPLVFVGGLWSWSLVLLSLGLLLRWEISYKRHPERFYEESNAALACANCPEKLCHHKKSLQHFLKKMRSSVSVKRDRQ